MAEREHGNIDPGAGHALPAAEPRVPDSGPPLLEARGLTWGIDGETLVGPLGLSLEEGETVAVVGPNGAGKTSLLRLLAGLLPPSAGSVEWEGESLAALPRRELARRLAYLPQQRPLSIPLSVERFVLLARYPQRRRPLQGPTVTDAAAVTEALERVGLDGFEGRFMDTLSGGERQRALLAAALAQEAPVWLLDEPTTHLDPRHQREVAGLLAELRDRSDHTLVLATHDLNLAAQLAPRVVALLEGRVAADGPASEVLAAASLRRIFGAPFEVSGEPGRTRVWLEL